MALFYAFLIFILSIVLSIGVYYYFKLKQKFDKLTKECKENKNSMENSKRELNRQITELLKRDCDN